MSIKTETVIRGYQEVEHILPAELLDLNKLTEVGGSVVEEFTVEVQRAKLETDHLVRISVPADKMDQFGGVAVKLVDGKWSSESVKKEDFAITEEVEVEVPDEEVSEVNPTPVNERSPLENLKVSLRNREIEARETITNLKASMAMALMLKGLSQEDVFAAGSAFVITYASEIQAFILAGGNSVAGQNLVNAVSANKPEWWDSDIEELFSSELIG